MSIEKFNWRKWLKVVFLLAIAWELFIFIRLPKQAFMQGLLESWLVSKGLVFYRDFFGAYLPFLRLSMVPLHSIFGYNQYTTIALAPLTSIAVLYFLYLSSKKWLTGWPTLLPVIFFSVWHTFLSNNHFLATSFLGLSVLISVIIWLSWWDKPTRFKSLLIGLFSAISVFTLQIVLPFFVLLNVSFILRYKKDRIRNSIPQLIASALGFFIPTLIIALWFLSKGALDDLYLWTIKYHFTNYPYANFGRETQNIFIYFSIHLPIILYYITNVKDAKKVSLLAASICLPLMFWFAIFHPVRFEISLPTFALIFGLGVQDLIKTKTKKLHQIGIVIMVVIVGINMYTVIKYKLEEYTTKIFETKYSYSVISEVYPNDPLNDAIEWMKVNSKEEEKVFVLADAIFYVKTNRLLANRRALASEPFVYVPFEEFKAEIELSWPSFWVIDERQWKRFDDFGYRELRGDFQELVSQDPIVAKFEYITIRKHTQ